MAVDFSQFRQAFFEEASDHLETFERLLLQISRREADAEELNSIFRAAHSIKGGAGMFGLTQLVELTHILESYLELVRSGQRQIDPEAINTLLAAVDDLRLLLDTSQADATLAPDEFAAMLERGRTLEATPSPQSPGAHAPAGEEDDGFGFFEPVASEPAAEEDEGFGLFAPPEAPPSASASTDSAPPVTAARQSAPVAPARSSADNSSIRVSIERVDQLINLVSELVITQSMLAEAGQRVEGPQAERLQSSLNFLERNTRDLQEAVMSIRMLPISFVFNRFPRVVRDLAHKLQKQVELTIEGETTELDRGLIEKLVDPLTHLVRNSVDHGIESPERRLAAGKPEFGSVRLRASQQGGNIVVEVIDDGGGLNRERILEKARERSMAVSDAMSDAEVWQLIFAPGFSTAAEVTDVSGRGVGMDVVRRNITDLGGRIEVASIAGQGTTLVIRLPLTLAILDGMSVALGREIFIVPLTYIIESLQPGPNDIRTVEGKGQVVHVRGEYLTLIDLRAAMGFGGARCEGDASNNILLIVQAGEHKAALRVDDLLGQHQVVIKSLDANYRRVQGVSGATIMGDGHVALILDVASIIQICRSA